MGDLVPFTAEPEPMEEPPDDSIAGAAWLAKLLRKEIYGVTTDPGLTTAERRDQILKFGKAITAATPNHELYEARKTIREDEEEIKASKLRGSVTSAKTSGTRRLRANAPRKQG